jgi:hypothetical protein
MSPKITIGFLVVLALLAGVVFALERFNVGQPQATDAAGNEQIRVFEFDDRQVTRFTARVGQQSVDFERTDDIVWNISDTEEAADRITITSILVGMGQLRGTKRVEDASANLAEFGLASPRMEARAEMEDGTMYALLIGDRSPIGTNVYARTADSDEAFLMANTIPTSLERLVQQPRQPPTATPFPTVTPAPATSTPAPAPDSTPTPGS